MSTLPSQIKEKSPSILRVLDWMRRRKFTRDRTGTVNKYHQQPQRTPIEVLTKGWTNTRQLRRAAARAQIWAQWQVATDQYGVVIAAPRDERGIMPRRTRRAIALALFTRVWRDR